MGFISLIAVYAPTEVGSLDSKEMFYAKLDSTTDQCPRGDILIVLGDFNAATGSERDGYEACVGPHGSGNRNVNSSYFLDYARSRKLRIAGSWFQRPDIHRWTWISNAGGVYKEIDHVLVSTRWRILRNCRVFRSAEFFATDHRLVIATLGISFKSRRIPRGRNGGMLHLGKLRDEETANEFARSVSNRFEVLATLEDPVELWDVFKRETLSAAGQCVGQRPRTGRAFISSETLGLIEESRAARLAGDLGLHRAMSRRVRASLRRDKEGYVRSICEEVERNFVTGNLGPAHRALKKLRSKSDPQVGSIKAADGSIVSDEDGIRACWAEYFEQLYVVDPPLERLPSADVRPLVANPPISEAPPSLSEVREAVGRLKCGKAPGICGISAELLKAGGEAMIHGLHSVVTAVWQSGTIPLDWKRGLVTPIYKGKGDQQDCNNYRGITLLSVPGKVFAHLLLARCRDHLLETQRPEQSGFTPKKSTTDRILALRVLVERRREFQRGLLAAYVDLKKAFDSVHRESLWELLRLRGMPAGIIGLISGLYSGTESAVKCGGGTSDFFPISSGVRQGCVLAPTLFNTCMDWIMGHVVDQSHCGTSIGEFRVTDLDFADDVAIFAETLEVLIGALDAFHNTAGPLGLKISWIKTKIQAFGGLLDDAVQSVQVHGENVEVVDRFTYLGSVVHSNGDSAVEVNRRLGLAYGVMDSLNQSIWRCRYLSRNIKIRVFKSLVLPVLLYASETWTLNANLRRRLNAFGTKSLRRIMGYRWFDLVSNERLLCEADMRPVTCQITKRQLQLFGHVARRPESDPAHGVVSAETNREWRRARGRPQNSWLGQVDRMCWDVLRVGRRNAWRRASRDPAGWRQGIGAAMRCRGVCPH